VDVPQGLTLAHHRDLEGRESRPRVRRLLLAVLAAFLALGLLNVFGQRETESSAVVPQGRLDVSAPTSVRSGLIFQARLAISAEEDLENATIVLDEGWLDGITLNTVVPSPVGEASRDGRVAFGFGRVPAGDEHVLFLQFQVNPTTAGRRSQDVELYDGERLLASLDRTLSIWP
jgi:hypothetical protein